MMLYLKKVSHNFALRYFPALLWLKKRIWFETHLKKKLHDQLREPSQHSSIAVNRESKKVLIPLIETNHYQYLQILIIAKALQLRGAKVKILLCGSLLAGCEIKNFKNQAIKNPCIDCHFNWKHIVSLFGIEVVKLLDYVSQDEIKYLKETAGKLAEQYPSHYNYKGIDIIPMTNDSVTRYYYGAVPFEDELLQRVRRDHLVTSMLNIEVARKIDEEWSPDIILNNMSVYTAWEPYYKYYKNKAFTESFTINISQFNYNTVVINRLSLYESSCRYMKFLKQREFQPLTEREKGILHKFLNNRVSGKSSIFKDLAFFDPKSNISDILKFDKSINNIFLFSNIYWDIGVSESGQLFNNVIEWVTKTIDILKDNDKVHLYIKPHPGEKYDSASSLKGVVDFIYEMYPQLPGNVTIIFPEYKINTYDLFPYIDLGVIYSGTLGLEMLRNKIPVIATGKTPFGGLGFAHEPRSLDEYKDELFGNIKPIIPDTSEVELFAYFYFIKTHIPWNLTERAYSDDFKGYTFHSLEDIMPGENKYLDHLCSCILDSQNTVVEGWE